MRETEYEVSVRTAAPVDVVWDELSRLDRLLENVPTVSSFDVGDGGRRASLVGGLARWPRSWRSLAGQAELVAAAAPRRLEWTITIPPLEMDFAGTFELASVGAEETNLAYRGVLCCGDVNASRLRRVLDGVLEDHVDALATRLATRAARRTAAQRALGSGETEHHS